MTGTRRFLPLAILAAIALSGASASSNTLDALSDRSDILGWEAVGRLDNHGRGFCSASLISPNYVLTAAHCLFEPDGSERVDPRNLSFSAGLRDGTSIATRKIQRAVVAKGFDPENPSAPESVRADVALLELADPIPATTADPFPVTRGAREGQRVTVLSYGKNRENVMSRESGCTVLATGNGLIAFDCQGHPGSSGAPIFDTSGRSPRILSIVSGTGPFDGQPATYGMAVSERITELRRAFRTGEGVWPGVEPTTRHTIGTGVRSNGSSRFIKP